MGSYQTKCMAVQQEIKSHLARLLATEDLIVEHKRVDSAQFNVHTRVLILPLWEKASNSVYDMLVGHEVGHALFTPDEDPPSHIPHQFVNVVEDARVEKLMKRKYMGLAKTFYNGYNELHQKDFFELDGEDIANFNLADRANLYFKVGSFLSLAFSPAEKQIITLIENAETFTQTITAAEALYNFCKQEQEKDSQEMELEAKQDALSDIESSGSFSTDDAGDNTSPVSDTDSDAPVEDRVDSTDSASRMDDSDVTVETAKALENNLQELVNEEGLENTYIEIPKVNLDTIIATNSEVHDEIDKSFDWQQKLWDERRDMQWGDSNIFEEVDEEYFSFKRDSQREVTYLVKEFECKKAASSYARASTSRTGVLDTSKLQTYKFNEDLFKKVTILPDGKNHGLIFVLDWSGSMQYVMQDTIKQLYSLVWFCKKTHIPFEVYAFTNEWNKTVKDYETGKYISREMNIHYEKKEGVFKVDEEFNLMNILTSKVNLRTLEKQLINIWRIVSAFSNAGHYARYGWPERLILSGTPLNESIIALHQILPKFQKENKLEKVQCVVLTDGEANTLPYHTTVRRNWESGPYLGCRNVHPNKCFLRDRKTGKVYKFSHQWSQFTSLLLKNLKDNFPFTNFIGIRILVPRDAKQFIRTYDGEDESVLRDWRRNRSFKIKNSGYDAYFGLSSTIISQDSEFDVNHDATKAQIKRAFVKSLKTKKLNKKVLGEFMELIS